VLGVLFSVPARLGLWPSNQPELWIRHGVACGLNVACGGAR
jgi:hypothetical protein